MSKSKFFEIFLTKWKYFEISTEIEILQIFDGFRNFSKFQTKSMFLEILTMIELF